MQKTIPFKKEILFKNTIEEITSIAIERDLKIIDSAISGSFNITGDYKYSGLVETFDFSIPYSCHLEDNYNTNNASVDISDFYYEVTEPNKLAICIEVSVDNLTEKPLLEIEEPEEVEEIEELITGEEVVVEAKRLDITDTPIFESTHTTQEDYMTYKVYIVREGDTIQTILEKYNITHEQLLKYNVVNELMIGEKIIIPHEKNQ